MAGMTNGGMNKKQPLIFRDIDILSAMSIISAIIKKKDERNCAGKSGGRITQISRRRQRFGNKT
jgi:hypothetical protein